MTTSSHPEPAIAAADTPSRPDNHPTIKFPAGNLPLTTIKSDTSRHNHRKPAVSYFFRGK
jgi:hypothetical protein